MESYAVVFNYSFDYDCAVYLFDDEESAKRFLTESCKEELRIDKEENGWSSVGYISDNGEYASIRNFYLGVAQPDVTEIRLARVYSYN